MMAVLLFLAVVAMAYDRTASSGLSRLSLQVLGGLFGIVGAFTGLIIFLGMLVYLFRWEDSSSKLLWVTVFLLTAWFGSSLYFFVVYRRQMGKLDRNR